MLKRVAVESAAEAYLELLAARGVEYFFGNAGTDFAPIVEAYAKRLSQGILLPRPITVPHEVTAVAMAHGYAMVSGHPQVVMVHVTVGTANALGGIMNACRANVPILVTAGRTPITEGGLPGARDRHIHWAQEAFDQGGLVREFVKWDYELRTPAQLETVVDRALAVAGAEPPGPVYLTLPREVLAERMESLEYADPTRAPHNSATLADPAAISEAARLLAEARNPIIIAKSPGRDPEAVAPLVRLVETLGAPLFDQWHTHVNSPQDHPLHAGYDPAPYLGEADVIVVVESDAPWFPKLAAPGPEAKVIQVAMDPLFSRYPIRGFPADVALAGTVRLSLAALCDAIVAARPDPALVAARRRRWEALHSRQREQWAATARAVSGDCPIDMAWLSRCINDVVDESTIVVNEYNLDVTQTCFTRPGTYYGSSPAAGLGWGLGAALGVKLAAPERTVVCCVGDGAYIFGSPTAAHFVSRAFTLPVVVVIFNNRAWNAVKRATSSYAPDGWAVRTRTMPLSDLEPAPDYELICQASGGHGERVEDPDELPKALAGALKIVREERRQALLNVICKKP